MACGVGNIYASAVFEQVVVNFQRIRQGAPHGLTLSSYKMAALAANCAPRGLSDDDMWAVAIAWWLAA